MYIPSSPKEVHIDFIQFSWWPRVTDPESWAISSLSNGLGSNMQKTPFENCFKFWHRVFCDLLSRPFDKIKMTRGWGRWPRDDFHVHYIRRRVYTGHALGFTEKLTKAVTQVYISKGAPIIECTCVYAWWAHMLRYPSVCPSMTWPKLKLDRKSLHD